MQLHFLVVCQINCNTQGGTTYLSSHIHHRVAPPTGRCHTYTTGWHHLPAVVIYTPQGGTNYLPLLHTHHRVAPPTYRCYTHTHTTGWHHLPAVVTHTPQGGTTYLPLLHTHHRVAPPTCRFNTHTTGWHYLPAVVTHTHTPQGGTTYFCVLLLPRISNNTSDVQRECHDSLTSGQLMQVQCALCDRPNINGSWLSMPLVSMINIYTTTIFTKQI